LANNQKAILTEELQLPVFERDPDQPSLAWAPPRPLDPALFAPVSFDRRYSAEWWWVNEEEACALRERQDREAAAQAAEALEKLPRATVVGRRAWLLGRGLINAPLCATLNLLAR
jgi:hypothetical protein